MHSHYKLHPITGRPLGAGVDRQPICNWNLTKAELRYADLRGANLQQANLRDANLQEADLWNANLEGADLCRTDLWGADLRRADLQGALLRNANLRGANLRRANLSDADLWRADLRFANLEGANLWDASLRRVDLHGANLDFAVWPLSCDSFDVYVDARLVWQLTSHLARVICNDPAVAPLMEAIRPFADHFCKHQSGVTPLAEYNSL